MHLTPEEEAMLEGAQGPGVRRAMEMVVALGRIYGARRLVPVEGVQVSGVSYKNLGEAGLEFLRAWAAEGARARVPAYLNPAGMDMKAWAALGIPAEFARQQEAVVEAFRRLGVRPTLTCAPYLAMPWPARGSHLAWAESSAVAFANSLAGARTNREGGPSALAAAITGRTAAYGLHLEENRQATVEVRVRVPLRDEADFGALGIWVGQEVGQGVPAFVDLAEQLPGDGTYHEGHGGNEEGKGKENASCPAWWTRSAHFLRALGAAMAAAGAVALFHVWGVTPEVRDAPALGRAKHRLEVTSLREVYARLNAPAEQVDLVHIGCPHASLEEIRQVAEAVAGQRLAARLWVTTGRAVREAAARRGWVAQIAAAGGHVVADTCAVVAPIQALGVRVLATNSAKTAFYAPAHSGVAVRFGNLARCLEAARTGRWPGGER
ncbi:MAG: aconitase X catalytic domain-containing protein [Anaerolineae bacterium]|nr:aconitase X catalytic domain-containing protein [Anaerolineae bacterium]